MTRRIKTITTPGESKFKKPGRVDSIIESTGHNPGMMSGLLPMSLAVAVPLWAQKMSHLPIEVILDTQAINRVGDIVGLCGEAILYKIKKSDANPGSAEAFNALAEGIARMAYLPGGIKTFGMHFEYTPGKWSEGKHGVPI